MAAAFAHEQHRTILVCHDEAVPAAKPRGGVHDHRRASNCGRTRAAVESRVIGWQGEGNAGAVLNGPEQPVFQPMRLSRLQPWQKITDP
jgi:hypothetical protein